MNSQEDRYYATIDELLQQADAHIHIPFGELDKTGRVITLKNKGALGQIVEEAIFEIKINSRPEPDIENLKVELKTTPFKRNKNGTISAKERTVLCIIDYNKENLNDFYKTHMWYKCSQILFLFYDGTKDSRKPSEYFIEKNFFFQWIQEDMPTILDDYHTIVQKIKDGKAETLSESDGNYLSTCTKGQGHGKDLRTQPFSDVLCKQRAWELKSSYITYLLNNYVFNQSDVERIIKQQSKKSFRQIIIEKLNPYIGMSKDELFNQFHISTKAKQGTNLLIREILGLRNDIDKTAEFQKANMNLRVIHIKYNGMPKEDNPFRCYSFKGIVQEDWESSQVKTEICDKRFMFVFFRASDKTNKNYKLDKIVFWGFPESLIPEAKRVWKETRKIIKDGVHLTVEQDGSVSTSFPTSKINKILFTKIHAQNSYYEIEKGKFVGKGKLSDTDQLPDGRHITKHSFWFPKKFIKEIYNENDEWNRFIE